MEYGHWPSTSAPTQRKNRMASLRCRWTSCCAGAPTTVVRALRTRLRAPDMMLRAPRRVAARLSVEMIKLAGGAFRRLLEERLTYSSPKVLGCSRAAPPGQCNGDGSVHLHKGFSLFLLSTASLSPIGSYAQLLIYGEESSSPEGGMLSMEVCVA